MFISIIFSRMFSDDPLATLASVAAANRSEMDPILGTGGGSSLQGNSTRVLSSGLAPTSVVTSMHQQMQGPASSRRDGNSGNWCTVNVVRSTSALVQYYNVGVSQITPDIEDECNAESIQQVMRQSNFFKTCR